MPALVLWSCVPLFYSSSLGASLANMALFRVLRGFLARFYGVRVGLCWLGGLRGFCVRVELGGYMTCCVFAFVFHLLLSSFLSFCSCVCLLLCALSFLALVVFLCPLALSFLSWFVFVFSFSLTDCTQKRKGAKVLPLASSLRVMYV